MIPKGNVSNQTLLYRNAIETLGPEGELQAEALSFGKILSCVLLTSLLGKGAIPCLATYMPCGTSFLQFLCFTLNNSAASHRPTPRTSLPLPCALAHPCSPQLGWGHALDKSFEISTVRILWVVNNRK